MATQKFPLFQWKNQEFLISLNPNNIEEMATQKFPLFQFKFGYPEIPWGNFFRFKLEMGIYCPEKYLLDKLASWHFESVYKQA